MKIERISNLERKYVNEVLDSGFRTSAGGKFRKKLEQRFAEKFGVKYAIAHGNGTQTLHSGLISAGIGKGDKVIIPPLTMASTAIAVLQCEGIPVFVDIDKHTWNIDVNQIEKYASDAKAIIPVHLYGLPCDMTPIMKLAEEYNLFVLEDSAQCFLGKYQGKLAGTMGHAGSFSFQSTKHITAGEGGMLITNLKDYALDVRRFGSLGYAGIGAEEGTITKEDIQKPSYERHISLGMNYIYGELGSAVALAQLERLDDFVKMRQDVAKLFEEAVDGRLVTHKVPKGYEHSYWTYPLMLEPSKSLSWLKFRKKFLEYGGDSFYGAWKINYLEPLFRGKKFHKNQSQRYIEGLCPISEDVQPNLIQLSTQYFDMEDATRQANVLRKTIKFFE